MNAIGWLQNLAAWVLWNSAGAALLVVLLIGVRLICGGAMSARLRSRLWLLVAARLLVPMLPAVSLPAITMPSRFVATTAVVTRVAPKVEQSVRASAEARSVETISQPQFEIVEDGMAGMTLPVSTIAPPPGHTEATPAERVQPKPHPIDWKRWLIVTWLAGASLVFARLLISNIRLWQHTRLLARVDDQSILQLLSTCCTAMKVRRPPMLCAALDDSAPALVGILRPQILLPMSLTTHLSHDELRLIFLHELAHLRRRDVLLNYLFAILVALHWFNPLIWIANWRMAGDRELACDEAVLAVTSRREARVYGCTLLKLVELLNSQRLPAGAVGVVQNKALIQRRIDMIASYPTRTLRSSTLVRIAAVSLAIAAGVSAIRAQSLPPAPVAPEAGVAPVNSAAPSAPAAVGVGQPPAPGALPPGAPAAPGAAPSVDPVVPPAVASSPRPGSADAATVPPGASSPFANLPRSVEDAAARQANFEVMQKLAKIHPAEVREMPLRDALAFIADIGNVDVVIDERVISEIGVDLDHTPLTLKVQPKPIEQILSLALRLSSPQLDYSIYNGVVFVSSRQALSRRLVTRIYDIPSSVNRDSLQQMISAAVGDADCNVFDQKAVITAPEVEQRDIAKLLAQFEQPPQAGPRADATFFLYRLHKVSAAEVATNFPKELGTATPDERTNSVLVRTPNLNEARVLISALDDDRGDSAVTNRNLGTASVDPKVANPASNPHFDPLISSLVANLEEALAAAKTIHGPEAPQVKILEQQLAEARIRGAAGGEDGNAIPPLAKMNPLEIDQMKAHVADARQTRMRFEEILNDLNRREASDEQPIDANLVMRKAEAQRQLAISQQQEASAQASYNAVLADGNPKQESAPRPLASDPTLGR